MEVRKSKLKNRTSSLELGPWKKKKPLLAIAGCWLLIFTLLMHPVLALTVDVQIEGPDISIFEGTVNTTQTTITASDASQTVVGADKAAAALDAAAKAGGFTNVYDNTAYGLFLTTIGGIKNKDDYSKTWGYRVNFKEAQLGVTDQPIQNGDKLLFFFSAWPYPAPLKLQVSKTAVETGEMFELKTEYYDDASSSFIPTSATLYLGGKVLSTDENGVLQTSLENAGSYPVSASKDGYVKSNEITLDVTQTEENTDETPEDNNDPGNNDQGGNEPVDGNDNNPNLTKKDATDEQLNSCVDNGIAYLRTQQGSDGMIDNPAVSAWATIAFAAANIDPGKVQKSNSDTSLLDYLYEYTKTSDKNGWLATDYARTITALYAANQDVRNFAGVNLIQELSGFYNNSQFGKTSLLNDDIFTIIAYRAANVSPQDSKYKNAIKFVLEHQGNDGGFSFSTAPSSTSDVDTTAAAIQALVLARNAGEAGLESALKRAYDWLISTQNDDGGFPYNSTYKTSSSQSGAWAIQAITSYKGNGSARSIISQSGSNPLYFQTTLQVSSGAFLTDAKGQESTWATASSIPACAQKPWLVRYSGEASKVSPNNSDNDPKGSTSGQNTNKSQSKEKFPQTKNSENSSMFFFIALIATIVMFMFVRREGVNSNYAVKK